MRLAVAGLAALCLLAGCATVREALPGSKPAGPELVIPDFPNAKEQFNFAAIYKQSIIPATDRPRRTEQLTRIIQCYERVVTLYPDDQVYTPVALLEIADSHGKMGDIDGSEREYRTIMERYPDNEYVSARALYSIARCHDVRGDFQKGKEVYREVKEKYGASQSGSVHELVKLSEKNYYKVHEKRRVPTKKKK